MQIPPLEDADIRALCSLRIWPKGISKMSVYYVDGKFVSSDEAVIPVDDLAVIRGFGVFDLLGTHNGNPLFLKEHLERLRGSAGKIGLFFPWSYDELVDVIMETLHRNHHPESNIRIVVTGGSSPDFITPQKKPRLLILVTPKPVPPPDWYTEGVKIITMTAERNIPGAKSIDYISATIALKRAHRKGAVEALYVDRNGFVLECTTSNIFAFFKNRLHTPGRDILSGITRDAVLKIAEKRYSVEIKDIKKETLFQADEVFLTGTNKRIVPIIQIDNTLVGNGKPGTETRRLMAALEDYTKTGITRQSESRGD